MNESENSYYLSIGLLPILLKYAYDVRKYKAFFHLINLAACGCEMSKRSKSK